MKFRFAHFFMYLAFLIVMGHAFVPHSHDQAANASMQTECGLEDWDSPFSLDMGEHHLENYQKPSSDLPFFWGIQVPLLPALPVRELAEKAPCTWPCPTPPLRSVYVDFPSLRAPPQVG